MANATPSMNSTKPNPGSDRPRNFLDKEQGLRLVLIGVALLYIFLILFAPALNVFVQAFSKGIGPFFSNLTAPDFVAAVQMTLIIAFIVVPLNAIFGLCAAWAIARHQFPGRALVISILDLPFAISPVVVGLMLVLLYGIIFDAE